MESMSVQERNQHESNVSKSNEHINTKDFLIGALIGGMVGAAAALFFTPKSGRELRSDINEQALVLKEKSGQLRETAMAKGSELAAAAKEKTNALTQTVSKQSTEIVKKVKGIKPTVNGLAEVEVGEDPIGISENDIQKKLEETKQAFDETEGKYN